MASSKQRTGAGGICQEKRNAELNIRNRSAKELNYMKKKTWFFIAVVCILLILAVSIVMANRPSPQDEMMDMLNRLENALGDEWKSRP